MNAEPCSRSPRASDKREIKPFSFLCHGSLLLLERQVTRTNSKAHPRALNWHKEGLAEYNPTQESSRKSFKETLP